jgi:hypothetical protein
MSIIKRPLKIWTVGIHFSILGRMAEKENEKSAARKKGCPSPMEYTAR